MSQPALSSAWQRVRENQGHPWANPLKNVWIVDPVDNLWYLYIIENKMIQTNIQDDTILYIKHMCHYVILIYCMSKL